MTGNGWLDSYDAPTYDTTDSGRPVFPVVSWSHNKRAMLAEVNQMDDFDMTVNWPVDDVSFGSGAASVKKTCYLADKADFCVLALRERWLMRGTEEEVDSYRDGAYSRLHVLAIPWDASEPKPVIITMKASAAAAFKKAYAAWKRNVLAPASKQAGRALSPSGFWLTISVGEPTWVGKGGNKVQTVLPEIDMPLSGANLIDWLGQRWVGEYVQAIASELEPVVSAWLGNEPHDLDNGTPEPAHGPQNTPQNGHSTPDDFDELPSASEAPAQAAVLFWNRAKALGFEDAPAVRAHAAQAEKSGDWTMANGFLDLLSKA